MEERLKAPRTVVKLGGSLLGMADLAVRLKQRFNQLRGSEVLVVVGGGRCADQIRDHEKWQSFWNEAVNDTGHWLAVRAMTFNSYMVEAIIPGAVMVAPQSIESMCTQGRITIVEPFEFLRSESKSSRGALPPEWDVTSDTIALRVARAFSADHLLMLKSCDCPPLLDPITACKRGIVDSYFQTEYQSASGLRVTFENFRSSGKTDEAVSEGQERSLG